MVTLPRSAGSELLVVPLAYRRLTGNRVSRCPVDCWSGWSEPPVSA